MIQQPTITLNNGVKMPMVGFGVSQIPNPDVCQKAVEEAIKTGYRLRRKVGCYGNYKRNVRRPFDLGGN